MTGYYFEGETTEPRAQRYSAQAVLDPIELCADALDDLDAFDILAEMVDQVEVIVRTPDGRMRRVNAHLENLEAAR